MLSQSKFPLGLFKSLLLLFSLHSFIPEAVCCRQRPTPLSYTTVFHFCLFLISKALFLQFMSGQGCHSIDGRATQRGPDNGRGNHPDSVRVAIDGTLNTQLQTKTGLSSLLSRRRTDGQADFKLLQSEPRPGRVCRSEFLFPSSSRQLRIALCDVVRVNAAEPIVLRGAP